MRALDSFGRVNVLVYGDVMLDESLVGAVDRISPEAPVPIVHVQRTVFRPGGAANVAANVVSLGGNVLLVGKIGSDDAGAILRRELDSCGIPHKLLESSGVTTRKTRVIANKQQLLRVDWEHPEVIDSDEEESIISSLSGLTADIVIISDYAKGAVTRRVVEALQSIAPVIVDPKPMNRDLYHGVSLLKSNIKECSAMVSFVDVHDGMRKLSSMLGCAVIVTRGEDGMSLFHDGNFVDIPTRAREVFDVIGAGDTVIAALALCLSSGLDMHTAAHVANAAAGIKVAKHGTATVSIDELKAALDDDPVVVL